jgi:hypothetical protein
MFVCKYCGKTCEDSRSLVQHEIRCKDNPVCIDLRSTPEAPTLSAEEKALFPHYYYLYQHEYSVYCNEYKQHYISLGYRKVDASILAKKAALHYIIGIDEDKQLQDGVWQCPVCGLHIKDMAAHVEKVHLTVWEDFVSKYDWKGGKVQFLDTHRKRLSLNKLIYYNSTVEGQAARTLLSEKYKGDNNPACRDEVKLKISKARLGQHMTTSQKEKISSCTTGGLYSDLAPSYGYTFWAFDGAKEIRFRSKCEYLIYLMFKYYRLEVMHEPYKIEYADPSCDYMRHYIVDYVYGNRLFEVKPSLADFSQDKKYKLIQNQLSKVNKQLEILTPNNFVQKLEISDEDEKPLSFFENLIIKNIQQGECKLRFPIAHDIDFYSRSSFVRKIGGLEVIHTGELLYEDKKRNRNN